MSSSSSCGEPAWAPRPTSEGCLPRRAAFGQQLPALKDDSAVEKMAVELRLYGAHCGSFKSVRPPKPHAPPPKA